MLLSFWNVLIFYFILFLMLYSEAMSNASSSLSRCQTIDRAVVVRPLNSSTFPIYGTLLILSDLYVLILGLEKGIGYICTL